MNNPAGYTEPREKVEIYLACRNLVNLDMMSKTDAFVILYEMPPIRNINSGNDGWVKTGNYFLDSINT